MRVDDWIFEKLSPWGQSAEYQREIRQVVATIP
jgi:hypothetical protein